MFNPSDWYWAVGGSTTQVYSSARNIYVPVSDEAYVAWVAAHGGNAVPISAEAEIWPYVSAPPRSLPDWLFDGTTFAQPTETTFTAAQLKAYAASVRFNKETGGFTFGGKPIVTTRESQGQITAAYNMAVHDSTYTANWKAADGSFTVLDATTIIAMAVAVGNFVSSTFSTEGNVAGQIDAGTITTTAQVDAAFAA